MKEVSLFARWAALKKEQPKIRIKAAAEELGVSEAELLATTCNGKEVVRLKDDFQGLFHAIERLGYVMALTRNESVVHERKGEYHNISFEGHAGLVLDPDIDLRIFIHTFKFAFAAEVKNPRGILRSIQFFDGRGKAIHKVYLMNEEHIDDYYAIVDEFRAEEQNTEIEVDNGPKKAKEYDPDFGTEAFLNDWAELKDTHDFFPLLMKYKAERTKALEVAEGRFTTRVPNEITRRMLEMVAERQVPIMVFVSSGGVIQIHTGEVSKIKPMNEWLNVMDPEFNLHLREDHIAHSWIVEKPTEDGVVTSLEIFDAENNNIATFFGKRKPGIPELQEWRDVVRDLLESGVEA